MLFAAGHGTRVSTLMRCRCHQRYGSPHPHHPHTALPSPLTILWWAVCDLTLQAELPKPAAVARAEDALASLSTEASPVVRSALAAAANRASDTARASLQSPPSRSSLASVPIPRLSPSKRRSPGKASSSGSVVSDADSTASRDSLASIKSPKLRAMVRAAVAVWLCCCVAVWLCGCVAVWL